MHGETIKVCLSTFVVFVVVFMCINDSRVVFGFALFNLILRHGDSSAPDVIRIRLCARQTTKEGVGNVLVTALLSKIVDNHG